MKPTRIETDYLIIGAGAMGMAFADTLINRKPKTKIIMVDKRAHPGGHWNDAYPFVRLHQPASGYGVNSSSLGQGGEDLSSRAEILFYYERVMKNLRQSGDIQFLPMSLYQGGDNHRAQIISVLEPKHVIEIEVRKKLVDASYMNVEVPQTHPPLYQWEPSIHIVPPNLLPRLTQSWKKYVVIGAGKTGIDAVLFLLGQGIEPSHIQWVISNDMWMWNRSQIQVGMVGREFTKIAHAIIDAHQIEDVFLSLEAQGSFFRLDKKIMPKKWRCATVSLAEFDALSKIKDIIRLGRVKYIRADKMELEKGEIPASPDYLYINCSANGLAPRPAKPIFSSEHILLQSVLMCQQVFSASVIAYLESRSLTNDKRNAIWRVIPHPEYIEHLPTCLLSSIENVLGAQHFMSLWLRRARLNLIAKGSLYRYAKDGWDMVRLLPELKSATQKLVPADNYIYS